MHSSYSLHIPKPEPQKTRRRKRKFVSLAQQITGGAFKYRCISCQKDVYLLTRTRACMYTLCVQNGGKGARGLRKTCTISSLIGTISSLIIVVFKPRFSFVERARGGQPLASGPLP